MRTWTVLLACLFALAACGKDEAPATTPSRELAKAPASFRDTVDALAPADSRVVVQFASASRLTEVMGAMARAFGAPDPGDPLAQMTGPMGIDSAQVQRDKPFAIAVSFDKSMPQPMPTFVLPFADGGAPASAGKMTEDGYAAVAMGGPAKPGGSALAGGLLAGDVSARVDLGGIIGMYRAEIDQGLAMAGAMMQQGMASASDPDAPIDMAKAMKGSFDAYINTARKLVDSAETLDMAATRRDDGTLDLDIALTAREGSPLDVAQRDRASLGALAAHVPADLPIVVLVRFDWTGYMKMMQGVVDAMADSMPEKGRDSYRKLMDKSMAMMEGFGEEWAMGFDLSAGGMRGVMVVRAEDGEALIGRYIELLKDPILAELGMVFEDLGTHEVAGVQAHRTRMNFDLEKYFATVGMAMQPGMPGADEMRTAMEAMLGEDGMAFEMAASGGSVVFAFGGSDDLLASALGGSKPPAVLEPALARVGGDLNFALYVDLRRTVKGIADLVRPMDDSAPVIAAGAPIPISMACGSDGRVHRFGMSCDVEEIAAFFRSLD